MHRMPIFRSRHILTSSVIFYYKRRVVRWNLFVQWIYAYPKGSESWGVDDLALEGLSLLAERSRDDLPVSGTS